MHKRLEEYWNCDLLAITGISFYELSDKNKKRVDESTNFAAWLIIHYYDETIDTIRHIISSLKH